MWAFSALMCQEHLTKWINAYSDANCALQGFTLRSWLSLLAGSRTLVPQVVMGGARSPEEKLADSVFQGTVLGPVLWNLFYEDARQAANRLKFLESVFADDFICWQGFGFRTTAAEIGLPAVDRQEHVLGKMR